MKKSRILLIITMLLVSQGFAVDPLPEYGMAGVYGDSYDGLKTTSGQIFSPRALTAAHKSLAYGTLIELESLETEKKVQLIINDRLTKDNPSIKISQIAAQKLGHKMTDNFYAKITILKEGTGVITNTAPQVVPESNNDRVEEDNQNSVPDSVSTNTNATDGYAEKTVERELVDKVIDLQLTDADLDKEFVKDEVVEEQLVPADGVVPVVKEETNTQTQKVKVEVQPATTNTVDPVETTLEDAVETNALELMDTVELIDSRPTNTNTTVVEEDIDDIEDINPQGDRVEAEEIQTNKTFVYEPKADPQLLLTNYSVIKVEKQEIDKELVIEIETPDEEEPDTNKTRIDVVVEPENKGDTNKVEIEVEKVQPVQKIDNREDTSIPDYNVDARGYSYAVQVGAFRKKGNALKLYDKLLNNNFPVFTTEVTVKGKHYTRVRVGYYGSLTEVRSIQNRIKSLRLPAIIVKIKLQEK